MHANVALFVPHEGCPHRCIFCDQRAISGVSAAPHARDVRQAAETALQSLGTQSKAAEIAFFGGSFTAIRREYMLELLEAAYPYIQNGSFRGIRLSTRPDAISEEILAVLQSYGVTAIELGAQSMNDAVLHKNGRGHTAQDVCNAAQMIRKAGFSLGLQMMTGMYGSTPELDFATGEALCALQPETVRIYPTVVMRHTALETLYLRGEYRPQTVEEAVSLCVSLQDLFESHQIRVIRTGLHSGGDVPENRVAGPYHPAFGELCMSLRMRNKIAALLEASQTDTGSVQLCVHPKSLSAAIGQRKSNLVYFQNQGISLRFLSDEALSPGQITVCRAENARTERMKKLAD